MFGSIGKRKKRILARLKGLREMLSLNPDSPLHLDLEQSLAEELEEICFQEELLWLQKSSSEAICLGDRNTSFYHTKALIKRRRNRITKLKDPDGNWVTNEADLASMVTSYFQHIYSIDLPMAPSTLPRGRFPSIPPADQFNLSQPIAIEEIRAALFEMKPLKSPGVDGLHALFFQSLWSIVGPSIHQFIQQVWNGQPLDPEVNRTLIALIPKSNAPSRVSEFRPISLCSVVYKILTKVLANRIQPLLPLLVGPFQYSFIQGRSIIDNIIIAQEVIHSMRKKKGKGGWFAIKVDLEKAFDSLRWDFIHDTLMDIGFPQTLSRTIMKCVTTPTMQVLWNGKASPMFLPQRGVRQGDPLSPYLFVLCMERLSQAISTAVSHLSWQPIKLGRRAIPLTHLFFADDLLIFGHTKSDQVNIIKSTLQAFCDSSGHKVNPTKTKIYFSRNTTAPCRRDICQAFGYGETESLGKHLGVPLITGRITSSTFRFLTERMEQKLSSWKARSLSLAGRITIA